ncbi:MAG: GGDEF domain-containing protein, partial [Candidatus Omnitrophota bacterium]
GAGDMALNDAASILKETCRESDVLARLGGDEFAILATGMDEKNAERFVSRLENNVMKYNLTVNRPYSLSLSVGMASCGPQDKCSLDELINQADGMMYEVKRKKDESAI